MAEVVWPFSVPVVMTGAALGYVIQRGGFCLMRALANLFLMGDATIARAYALALLVAMAAVQALSAAGLVDIPIRPFHWMSNSIGGPLFRARLGFAAGLARSTRDPVGAGWLV